MTIKLKGSLITLPSAIKTLENERNKVIRNIRFFEKNNPAILKHSKIRQDKMIAASITLVLFELRKYL